MLRTAWGRIGLYVVLTFLFSSVFDGMAIATGHIAGGKGAYSIGSMWCPAVAAILTCKLTGVELSTLGWGWGRTRWQLVSYLLPLAYAGIAYLAVWAFGLGSFPNADFVAKTRDSLGWTGAPDAVVLVGWFLLIATTGLIRGAAYGLGEEIGWRGFLAPQLIARLGFTGGALVTGLIWWAWHLPVLIFSDYNSGTPWWYGMSCFLVLVLAISVPMAWLRLRSGSLWTAAILHGSHNDFIQTFFTPATAPRGGITAYAIDEFGFATPLVAVLFAVGFWMRRREAMAAFAAQPAA